MQPLRAYIQEVNAPAEKLRIAWTTRSWQPGTEVHSEVIRCIEDVVEECEAMGHDVLEDSPVFDYEEYLRALCVAWGFGFDVRADALAAITGRHANEDTLEPVTMSYYQYARSLTASDMMAAEAALNRLRRNFGKFFEQYDVLLTPTLAQLPEPLGKYALTRTDVDFVGYFRLGDETCMYLPLFNVTGQPAITLPLGQSRSGLPIGAQFAARFGSEDILIRLASDFEQAMPWRNRVPPVHASR